MEELKSVRSITFILCGSLVYSFTSLAGGWTAGLASLFGFILMLQGLNILKRDMDSKGKSGVQTLALGAVIGGIASLFDLIPIVGHFAGFFFLLAFIIELVGFFRLKKSNSIGYMGKVGIQQILVAYFLLIVGAMISLIPAIGGIFASLLALLAMIFILMGWLKVQEGLGEKLRSYSEEPILDASF